MRMDPLGFKIQDRTFFAVLSMVVGMIILDTGILRVSVFLTSQLYQGVALGIFVALSISLLGLQYLILRYIRTRLKASEEESVSLRTVRSITATSLYAMLVTVVVLIFQMVSGLYFQTFLLTTVVAISYSVSIIALSFLTIRFLKWYRSDRNSLVLVYGLASLLLVLNAVFTLTFAVLILNDKNSITVPHVGVSVLNIPAGSVKESLNQIYTISSITSFVALWIATTLHLHYYSRRFGRARYWTALGIPLAYFLVQFVVLFVDIFDPLIEASPTLVNMILTIAFTASKPVGGILFGIAFWIIARKTANVNVKNYLTISAYGLVLFFASNQAVVLVSNTFYPPFGFGSVSYAGISSYLILVGIFFSAASISQDKKILVSIRKSAIEELKLLGSMGSSESKEQLVGIVTRIAKKNQEELTSASGIESSLSEDDMKKYLDEVISEVESVRNERKGEGERP